MGTKPQLIVQPRLPHPSIALTFHRLLTGHLAVSPPANLISPGGTGSCPFQELVQRETQIHSVNVYEGLCVASGPGLQIEVRKAKKNDVTSFSAIPVTWSGRQVNASEVIINPNRR